LERGTARELRILQVLDGGKVLVDQRGIGQRPEVLRWLQLGGVWGQ